MSARRRAAEGVQSTTLDRIKPGERARTVRVCASSGPVSRRLVDMRATRGVIVEVRRVAPLGDPIEVTVKGYHLSLRKEDAGGISAEPVEVSAGE